MRSAEARVVHHRGPDKFKGSLPAAEIARIVASAPREVAPAAQVIENNIADGAVDLTVRAAIAA